ncbi:hypothetical protein [Leptothoe sp. PORK10 BA2]|uniref:hypothetical protein n=1 Tax=Leptothoe sp. PORK10 BA2 TaxID=3110254 RepID=UPI002B22060B|nr:hypothetical protein [Leptothoe sp. PORK10 BA2]MEA5466150.1 hypothetical protein [Leptothoe sp. PORK10 BA2]
MSLTLSTNLTEKQEIFSAGVSQKSYNKLSSLNPLHESKEKSKRILFSLTSLTLTDDTSSIREEYFQASINHDEAVRRIFLHKGVANFQYLQETGTSTFSSVHFSTLNSIPYKVKECFDRISHFQEGENNLYETSSLIAEWLMDAPHEYQTFFAGYIQTIPSKSVRILIAALSDAEFSTDNSSLVASVSSFIKSTDKRLAQTAAAFLLICGGSLGKDFLFQVLATQELPHSQLVRGISKLLS